MKGLYNYIIKNLKENKKRTIVTFIGIVLSCSLLFGVGLFSSTIHNNSIREAIRYNGSHHIKYKNIEKSKIDIIKNDFDVKEVKTEVVELIGTFNNDKYNTTIYVSSLDIDYNNILNLIQGTMPTNNKEVIIPINFSRLHGFNVDDKILIDGGYNEVEYKIVGIYKDNDQNDYNVSYGDENFYTYFSLEDDSATNVFVTLKSPKDGLEKLQFLTNKIGLEFPDLSNNWRVDDNVYVNESLLSLYGEIGNAGTYAVVYLSAMLILTVLSIVCILIIYNSFAISVTERKKQLGILSSIGATPAQILKSVFLEAGIISIIAIPVSFVFSLISVALILEILNKILDGIIVEPLVLAISPSLILMSLVFIIISIFFSSLFPAMRASEVTPIEAIRLSKDIKIKGKKIKSNKLITKLFGIEGDISFKNIKRHKKRYRTTVISLVISIILFITTSTYLNAAISNADEIYIPYKYDVVLDVPEGNNQLQISNKIKDIDEIKDITEYKRQYLYIKKLEDNVFNREYLKISTGKDSHPANNKSIMVILLSDNTFQKYAKKIGLTKEQPILINHTIYTKLNEFTKEVEKYEGPIYKDNVDITIDFCNYEDYINYEKISNCYYQLTNFYFTNIAPSTKYEYIPQVIVNKQIYNDLMLKKSVDEAPLNFLNKQIALELNIKNAKRFDEKIKQIFNEHPDIAIDYQNHKLENHSIKMSELAVMFALYSFIGFITLIGVTSVINTINTSINLRKIEFAMLRSVGQTPRSFNRMIRLESIFLGLKSLFYGLGISFFIIYIITQIASLSYGENKIKIPIPYIHIIICIITVFIIIFITMKYATNKVKNDNIIDTIRKENI